MEKRWKGILRASLDPKRQDVLFKVAASLCLSPSSKTLTVPSVNAIFFNGDRVRGTGNPVIERLSDALNIADILVSKLGASVNVWVVESSTFSGPFAVYKEFIPSINSYGEPKCYDPHDFPASTSTVRLLSKCLQEVKSMIHNKQGPSPLEMHFDISPSCLHHPKTIILGFSKGGTVLNQILTELAHAKPHPAGKTQVPVKNQRPDSPKNLVGEHPIFPISNETFLNSLSEVHYVDVGLNSVGAYLNNQSVIKKIVARLLQTGDELRFTVHGTPRQWHDNNRPWIRNEKDLLLHLLQEEACLSGGKLQVYERSYFIDRPPDLQMHFEIIENILI